MSSVFVLEFLIKGVDTYMGFFFLAGKRRDSQIFSERHGEFSIEVVMPGPAVDDALILQVVRAVLVILGSPRDHSYTRHMGQVFLMQTWHVTWPFRQTGTGIWVAGAGGQGREGTQVNDGSTASGQTGLKNKYHDFD